MEVNKTKTVLPATFG